MTVKNNAASVLRRLVAPGFGPVFAGAPAIGASAGAVRGVAAAHAVEPLAILAFGSALLTRVIAALARLAPISAFSRFLKNLTEIRFRVVMLVCLGLVIADRAVSGFMANGAGPDEKAIAKVAGLTFFMPLVDAGLTWRAFRIEVQR